MASAGYYAGVLTYVIARTATVTGWQPGVRIRLIVPLAILASGVWTVAHEQQLPNHALYRTASLQTHDGPVRLTAFHISHGLTERHVRCASGYHWSPNNRHRLEAQLAIQPPSDRKRAYRIDITTQAS